MVTVVAVRGHAPREVGSKMILTAHEMWGSIGGGSLEKTAVERGRAMLEGRTQTPELLTIPLVPGPSDAQVCGGEVTVFLEPLRARRPCVGVFGVGHVGLALARILGMLPIELWLVDARPEMLSEERIGPTSGGPARLVVRAVADPAGVVDELPVGAHVVVVTHDQELDVVILRRALRREDLGFVGCIGSPVKRVHVRSRLLQAGLTDSQLDRLVMPIGLPEVPGKSPAAIAIATAAQLLRYLEAAEP